KEWSRVRRRSPRPRPQPSVTSMRWRTPPRRRSIGANFPESLCAGPSNAAWPPAVDEQSEHLMDKHPLELVVNGEKHLVVVEHRKTLADTIRDDCGLTGTHVGCEHGVCGACTIIVDGKPVRSCLMFAHQAEGQEIRTVESLADGDKLHPLQQAFIDNHALQCGFCTPGFLMLIVGAFESDPDISDEELIELLSSNLCRCTGYQNIIKAARSVLGQMRNEKAEA